MLALVSFRSAVQQMVEDLSGSGRSSRVLGHEHVELDRGDHLFAQAVFCQLRPVAAVAHRRASFRSHSGLSGSDASANRTAVASDARPCGGTGNCRRELVFLVGQQPTLRRAFEAPGALRWRTPGRSRVEQLQNWIGGTPMSRMPPWPVLTSRLGVARLPGFLLDPPLDRLDLADLGKLKVLAIDERFDGAKKLLAQVQVAGHRADLDERLPLPSADRACREYGKGAGQRPASGPRCPSGRNRRSIADMPGLIGCARMSILDGSVSTSPKYSPVRRCRPLARAVTLPRRRGT